MNEQLSKILNHPMRVPISVGVVAFGAGVGLGYILGRRNTVEVHEFPNQLEMEFDVDDLAEIREIAKQNKENVVIPAQKVTKAEIYEAAKQDKENVVIPPQSDTGIPVYEMRDGKSVKVDPIRHQAPAIVGKTFVENKIKEVVIPIEEAIENALDEAEAEKEADVAETVKSSVFAHDDDDWNYAKEIRNRKPSEPYVIHKDEFYSEEKGYSQNTFIYYAGDNIMCDEDDSPVYNHADVTGPLLFGHGSADPNVVHIRNDKRKSEYEICYDPGLYSVEVLGLEIEDNQRVEGLKHSKKHFRLE